MIVKSFSSDTVAGALKKARTELGGDAVILKTRRLDAVQAASTGDKVEVTACIDSTALVVPKSTFHSQEKIKVSLQEKPAPRVTPRPVSESETATANDKPSSTPVSGNAFPKMMPSSIPTSAITQKLDFLLDILQVPARHNTFPNSFGRLFATLLNCDFPEYIAYDLTEQVMNSMAIDERYRPVAEVASDLIRSRMPKPSNEADWAVNQRVVILGPAGAGKSALMGRLAGYMIGEKGLPVNLTSLDQIKVSAPEELQTYAEILDVDYFETSHNFDQGLWERCAKDKLTIIDTPALNGTDPEGIEQFARKLRQINPNRVICAFSSLMRSADVFEMIKAFRPLNITDLAFTMTDLTTRHGSMFVIPFLSGLPVTMVAAGTLAADISLDPNIEGYLHNLLAMGREGNDE